MRDDFAGPARFDLTCDSIWSNPEVTLNGTAIANLSPLQQMTQGTPTCLWNDSAALQELTYSISHGCVGATCNPVIVLEVLKKEMPVWRPRIAELIAAMPSAGEHEIAWRLVEEITVKAAKLLEPAFQQHEGRNGRLSVQTDPRNYRNTEAILRKPSGSPSLRRTSS